MDEAEYRADLAKNGVELPEEPQAAAEEPAAQEEPKPEPLQEPKPEERKPRSIYDEYKEKKSELKSEREAREHAERERDELKALLNDRAQADTPQDKQEAQDEIDAFLTSHREWDKQAIQDLVQIARKGVKPELDDGLKRDMEEFKAWKSEHSKTVEVQRFNEEFQSIVPTLKQSFPNASQEELEAIRKELDVISHTKEWHDKDLEYVAYKHRDKLSALVSPKKRGMEPKGRRDAEETSFEFDPTADYAAMTPAERTIWEKNYKEMTKSSQGLSRDAQGRRLLI